MSTIIAKHRTEIDQMMKDMGRPKLGSPGGHVGIVFVSADRLVELEEQLRTTGKRGFVLLTDQEREDSRSAWPPKDDPRSPSDERTVATIQPWIPRIS